MLDVHVLVMDYTPDEYVGQCVRSILLAARRSAFQVQLHLLHGWPGHVGRGRQDGYARGMHPYVTYVDDDDYLLPDAFVSMEGALGLRPTAVFTPELTIQNGQMQRGHDRHHLAVYAREILIDHASFVVCGDYAQMLAAEKSRTVVDLPEPGYVHRLYQSEGRKLRRKHPDEWRKVCGKHPA
jgi:hypothetical protein